MKRLFVLFAFLLLSLSLSGCGEKKEEPKDEKIIIKVEPSQPAKKQPSSFGNIKKKGKSESMRNEEPSKKEEQPKKEIISPGKHEPSKRKIYDPSAEVMN